MRLGVGWSPTALSMSSLSGSLVSLVGQLGLLDSPPIVSSSLGDVRYRLKNDTLRVTLSSPLWAMTMVLLILVIVQA